MSVLPENHCEGSSYTPPSKCATASKAFLPGYDCDKVGGPEGNDCLYGNANFVPPTAACLLTAFSTGAYATRCLGRSGPAGHPGKSAQPYFCVFFADGYMDGDGNTEAFYGREAMIDFLTSNLSLEIDPCAPTNYCPTEYHAIWLTRALIEEYTGWRMQCNQVEHCTAEDPPPCEQHVVKPISIKGLTDGISVITLATGTAPYCFGLSSHHFCLLAYCGEGDDKLIDCVGDSHAIRARAVDRLYVTLSCRYGDDTSLADTSTTELMNAMWSTLNDNLDQLDAPGHSAYQTYHASSVRRWTHGELFGSKRAIEINVSGTISGQTFEISMDENLIATYTDTTGEYQDVVDRLVTSWNSSEEPDAANITAYEYDGSMQLVHDVVGENFEVTLNTPGGGANFTQFDVEDGTPDPVVQGTPSYYSEYDEADIPITLQGSCSGSVYTELATLRLQQVAVVADFIAEERQGESSHRISGIVKVELKIRVQRDVAASGKFSWLNPADYFDLRLEDPDNLGNEHPRERILATGPNGERVWRQGGDGTEGYIHRWEGLKCSQSHSVGPNTFDEYCEGATGACCGFLRTMDSLVVHGRSDDNTGLEDRFKITRCHVGGTLAGETFKITLSDGHEEQLVAEHTDTTGNIDDTVAALVGLFNASAEAFAADVVAAPEYNAIKLTPDHSEVPMYDVLVSVTAGSATFTTSIEHFSELPQYYEGSISFGTADNPNTVGCGCA